MRYNFLSVAELHGCFIYNAIGLRAWMGVTDSNILIVYGYHYISKEAQLLNLYIFISQLRNFDNEKAGTHDTHDTLQCSSVVIQYILGNMLDFDMLRYLPILLV